MKYFVSLLSASLLGALIALAGVWWLAPERMASFRADQPMAVQTAWHNTSPLRPGAVPADFTEPSEKAMPAVVHISASGRQPVASNKRGESFNPFRDFFGDNFFFGNPFDRGLQASSGSGVIYTSDGYIITNNHVIELAQNFEVTLYDNRKFKATLVGADPKTDLAVLKIEATGLPTLELADSDKAKVGQWVLAVGNPFDLTSTVTAGIISAKGRNIRILRDRDAIESFIQTDAAVNPGNSGGALVDDQGRLLGINTAIATQTGSFAGYSFAIPSNLMRRIVEDLMEYGSFQRPYLGINIYDLDSEAARELNVKISQGVVVESLVDGGSAQFAGLQPKDVITKVDDRPIKDTPALQEIVSRAKVGDTLRVGVVRRGEEMEIAVPLRPEK
jgi:serine protease Do